VCGSLFQGYCERRDYYFNLPLNHGWMLCPTC
jgi:hypothetical protein